MPAWLLHVDVDTTQVVEVKKTFVGALVRIQAEARAEVSTCSCTAGSEGVERGRVETWPGGRRQGQGEGRWGAELGVLNWRQFGGGAKGSAKALSGAVCGV